MNIQLQKLLLIGTAILLLACLSVRGVNAAASKNKPNVILILADDLGYGELGCYGCPDTRTPVMDQLAKDGVRCTDGYAAFPVCSPSRAAILTGRFPARISPAAENYGTTLVPEKHATIGNLMQEAGYRTGCFGKWNVSSKDREPANDYGFDRWVGLHLNHDFYAHTLERTGALDMYEDGKPYPDRKGTWCDTVFADEAIRFIKAESEKPFFVYLPFQAPHAPFQDPDIPMDKPQEKNRPTLIKMIERLDLEIGRVLKTLDDENLADNTLVILTSDNGGAQEVGRNLPLGGAKQLLQEGGIRVPLILRWPGVLAEGETFSSAVSAYDLTATVAAAAGANPAPDQPFDGVDLLPALTGKAELDPDRPLFFRRTSKETIRQSAVRQGDWKYLRNYKHLGGGVFSPDKYNAALYNLSDDLAEENDLAASNPEKLKAMSDLLEKWEAEMSKTAAPFPTVVPKARPRKKERK